MSADTSDLTKVDSAIAGVSDDHPKDAHPTKRRTTSSAPGVMNINDLGKRRPVGPSARADTCVEKEGTKIEVSPDTQKTGW
jgi:hypothetical protein